MTIDGQNNLHIRNTHTVEETKFCKILQFERECKRDIGGGRERERKTNKCSPYNIMPTTDKLMDTKEGSISWANQESLTK